MAIFVTRQAASTLIYRTAKVFYQGNYTDEDMMVRWHTGMSVKDFGSNTFLFSKVR